MAVEKLYKVRETASCLNVSTQLVYKLVREGRIKAVRIGSAIRIPASSIEGYIQSALEALRID